MEIALCQNVRSSTSHVTRFAPPRHFTYFTFWLASFCIFVLEAQAGVALIEGTVHGENGPLPGANIQLTTTNLYTVSSDSGLFRLEQARPGRCTLAITYTGHQRARYAVMTGGEGNPPTSILITPGVVLAVRTADGRYAKVQIMSYYKGGAPVPTGAEGESARFYTFRYVFQPDGSRRFD